MANSANQVTACLLVIGDEILSGRTRDANLAYLAKWLNDHGIRLAEARVIPDEESIIASAVNTCRQEYDYVFTTGGIGPTHDDITAPSIAKAFAVDLVFDPKALQILGDYYGPDEFTDARMRMARIPEGATLIENPASLAPGFQIENVFVLAGVPAVMRAMLESLKHRLEGGTPVSSETETVFCPESKVAGMLETLQSRHDTASVGSYPFYRDGRIGTCVVIRSESPHHIERALNDLRHALDEAEIDHREGEVG